MSKCTPCEMANNEVLKLSKTRAIEEAIKKGKESGEKYMAIGITEKGKQRYSYAFIGDEGGLRNVEYISVV